VATLQQREVTRNRLWIW